jgi:hypothetical protein
MEVAADATDLLRVMSNHRAIVMPVKQKGFVKCLTVPSSPKVNLF